MVVVGHAFHRNAEVQFTVDHVHRFSDLYVGDVAHVDHGGVHAHTAKNRAKLSANRYKAFIILTTQITVTITDSDRCDACGLLCGPVASITHGFTGLYVVDMANGRLDSHHRFNRPGRGCCTHAVVAVKGKARAHHVKVAFGVGEGACRTRAMANLRAKSFGFQHVDKARETLDLDVRLRVPRHVGRGEVREHPFKMQALEGECRADVVEVLGVEAVAVHARIDGEVRLAGRPRFLEVLVERHGGTDVRDGGGQLELDEVGEVRGSAGAEYENRQVHTVLAEQHSFADVGHSQVVGTAELGGKRAGEAPVAVRIGLDG